MLEPRTLELNNDQRREVVNTQQRYRAWRAAKSRLVETRGSMVWQTKKGADYLMRSYYDKSGQRKQRSLGVRSEETERLKGEFERGRDEAKARFKEIDAAFSRQAAINRALALGRVPLTSANIIRALDDAGVLGAGIRVVGTNAVYAYEAVAGVMVDASITTTGDIDLLFDSRGGLRFVVSEDVSERSLMTVLKSVDKTFERTSQTFRAENAEGYLVDLIKPMRNPPWKPDDMHFGGDPQNDLMASEIEGLVWLENAPVFEAVAIDERGFPLRIAAADPRVWAAHKYWISMRADREPVKRRRDSEQAIAVAGIVRDHLTHLPFEISALKMLPRDVAEAAQGLFTP